MDFLILILWLLIFNSTIHVPKYQRHPTYMQKNLSEFNALLLTQPKMKFSPVPQATTSKHAKYSISVGQIHLYHKLGCNSGGLPTHACPISALHALYLGARATEQLFQRTTHPNRVLLRGSPLQYSHKLIDGLLTRLAPKILSRLRFKPLTSPSSSLCKLRLNSFAADQTTCIRGFKRLVYSAANPCIVI